LIIRGFQMVILIEQGHNLLLNTNLSQEILNNYEKLFSH